MAWTTEAVAGSKKSRQTEAWIKRSTSSLLMELVLK